MKNADSIRACAKAKTPVQSYVRLHLLISKTSSYNWCTQLSAILLLSQNPLGKEVAINPFSLVCKRKLILNLNLNELPDIHAVR